MTAGQPELNLNALTSTFVFAVVIAALNERRHIGLCIQSLDRAAAHLPKDAVCHVVVAAGASNDGTQAELAAARMINATLHVIENPRTITPAGFNVGIRHALALGCQGVTIFNAHTRATPEMLTQIVSRYRQGYRAFGIKCVPVPPVTVPERIITVCRSSFLGRSHYEGHTRTPHPTDRPEFPSFAADVFEQVGFFDERLVRNQDIEFASRLIDRGCAITAFPDIHADYSPRRTLPGYFRMLWNDARFLLPTASVRRRAVRPMLWIPALSICTGIVMAAATVVWPSLVWLDTTVLGLYAL